MCRYMMREKIDESQEWKAVTSEEQRQAVSDAVANAIAWFDDEVGIDTNTSQARCCEAAMFFFFAVFSADLFVPFAV